MTVEAIRNVFVVAAVFVLPPALSIGVGVREVRWAESRLVCWFAATCLALNVIMLLAPLAAFLFLFVGSPTAQLNDPNPPGINWWRVWGRILYPTLEYGLTASLMLALVLTLFAMYQTIVRSTSWWRSFVVAALAILHAAIQLLVLFQLSPRA